MMVLAKFGIILKTTKTSNISCYIRYVSCSIQNCMVTDCSTYIILKSVEPFLCSSKMFIKPFILSHLLAALQSFSSSIFIVVQFHSLNILDNSMFGAVPFSLAG